VLVQEYIDRPFLLHGRKFDLRVYVLVTSYDPLRAYTYENGLVRFATEDYIAPNAMDPDCEMRKSAHITNYSVQKKSSKYIANANAEEDSTGHKWSLEALMRELAAMGHDVDSLRKRIDEILVKTLIAAQPHICTKYNARFRRRNACFEVFGFDIMLDEALTPWIIEVNVSPDLSSSSPLDRVLKGNLAADVFQLLGIRANRVGEALGPEEPPLLTRANCGHSPNELSTVPLCELGKLELECLVEAEEEWWRASLTNFRTLIPTAASVRKFGPRFSTGGRASTFSSPRYADFLLAGYVTRARRCNELHSAVQSGKSEVMRPSSASVQPECANPISAASTGLDLPAKLSKLPRSTTSLFSRLGKSSAAVLRDESPMQRISSRAACFDERSRPLGSETISSSQRLPGRRPPAPAPSLTGPIAAPLGSRARATTGMKQRMHSSCSARTSASTKRSSSHSSNGLQGRAGSPAEVRRAATARPVVRRRKESAFPNDPVSA